MGRGSDNGSDKVKLDTLEFSETTATDLFSKLAIPSITTLREYKICFSQFGFDKFIERYSLKRESMPGPQFVYSIVNAEAKISKIVPLITTKTYRVFNENLNEK